jgi:putative hemolysin
MFTVDQVLTDYYPSLTGRKRCTALLKPILRKLLHEASFLEFAENYPHLQGIEFIEQVFEYFKFSYTVSDREREHIPVTGKVIIIANHPIGHGKRPLLQTESAIARPERRSDLKKAMEHGEQLGTTPDGKTIYRFSGDECPVVLREIGRLRELTFRSVGEGSGKRRDIDRFDSYYEHLILWDEDDLEIAGAYRFVDAGRAIRDHGPAGIYSCSLFTLDPADNQFLNSGLELGRSFVQQRYWGKRSLDYLWYGIGAFLRNRPHYRYLFGPVSISNDMPQLAKELLISFYRLYFSAPSNRCYSRNPFVFSQPQSTFGNTFSGNDYRQDFTRLKLLLNNLGTAVPPLYKQYTELCEPGGVIFLDFNIDSDFNNCVDGLVIVDTQLIRQSKRKRYMEESILV